MGIARRTRASTIMPLAQAGTAVRQTSCLVSNSGRPALERSLLQTRIMPNAGGTCALVLLLLAGCGDSRSRSAGSAGSGTAEETGGTGTVGGATGQGGAPSASGSSGLSGSLGGTSGSDATGGMGMDTGGASNAGGDGGGGASSAGAGNGGSSGSAADAGVGGTAGIEEIPAITATDCSENGLSASMPPCANLCGNGAIDSCIVYRPPDATFPPTTCGDVEVLPACIEVSESCDGAALSGTSCTDLEFAGGTLACSQWCAWDVRDCDTCTTDAHVTACNEHFSDAAAAGAPMGLSSDGTRAVVALTGYRKIHVRAVGDDLRPLGEEQCYLPGGVATGVAVARVPGGFLLVTQERYGSSALPIQIMPLDADGVARGMGTQLETVGGTMTVVERPDGGPLVLVTRLGVNAFLVNADGRTERTVRLFDDRYSEVVGAGYVAGGFVAWAVSGVANDRKFETARLELDGTLTKSIVPDSERPFLGPIAVAGNEARSVWIVQSEVMLARLDENGMPLGAPETIATGDYASMLALTATETGTVAVLRQKEGGLAGPGLVALWIDGQGASSTAYEFARATSQGDLRLTAFGSDGLAAYWQLAGHYPGGVKLARLAP